MKKIASPKEMFSRAWVALKATWKTVLPLVAAIQLASYVLSQLASFVPGMLGTILSFVATAVIMVPTVGVLSGVLGYFRGKPLTADCVGSMRPHAVKIIFLYFWTGLCLFGWMLPGMGGMLVGNVMMLLGMNVPGAMALGAAVEMSSLMVGVIIGSLLMLAGMLAMIVLACRAVFSYAMSNSILIDDPATPVRDILKKSKTMMHGYRWHYFKMGMPVFVGMMVIALVIGLLTAALPAWLSSLISTAMSVVTATMSQYLLPVMYEELKRIGR